MTKNVNALAALASTAAFAQSSVTLSGAVAGQFNKTGTDRGVTSVGVAELTFSAKEDLGGGMGVSAAFTIENMNNRGYTADAADANGTASTSVGYRANGPTNADSNITFTSSMGTVAVANTRSANLAANANVFGTSISNAFYETVASRPNVQVLSYTSPELAPGLKASVGVANVGNTASSQAAKVNVVGVSYANGPLALGLQQKSNNAAAVAATSGTKKNQTEMFASYDLGVAKIGVGQGSKTLETGKSVTTMGVSVPMGAATLGADYGKRGDAKFAVYGVRYALSKRTTLHISAGKYQTTATNSANESRIRLAHTF